MSKAEIHSGICGFSTTVEATMDGKVCRLAITSDCQSITKLSEELAEVDPFREISHRRAEPLTFEMASKYCPHAACPVPVGIIKAVEIARGLALPADVSIRLTPNETAAD